MGDLQKPMTSSGPTKKRLMRNPHRSRVGGICAGLSDYTGLSQTLFRLVFLISLFFGGFGLWVYLILWIALPSRDTVPITDASLMLRWHLFKIGREVAKLHRTQPAFLADQTQLAYDAIRRLASRIDPQSEQTLDQETTRLALIEFPSLLNQIQRAGSLMTDAPPDERIKALRSAFDTTCNRLIEASHNALEPPGWRDSISGHSEIETFRANLRPLTRQLSAETSPIVMDRLKGIETLLENLLTVPEMTLNDLGPVSSHEVRRIAFTFLPETLEAYLKVQSSLARSEPIRDEKTAEEHLNDQLELLDQTLHSYAKALYDRDAKSLLIQGHFLREKFSTQVSSEPNTQSKDIQQ